MTPTLILLADDDPDTVEAYSALFRSQGYSTHAVADGAAALTRALELRPHLVVLDVGLPGMDGVAVLRRLRAEPACARIPVIIVTGHAFPHELEQVRGQGADAVLVKPCEPGDLCATVQRLLEAATTDPRPEPQRRQVRVRPKPRRASTPPVEPGEG